MNTNSQISKDENPPPSPIIPFSTFEFHHPVFIDGNEDFHTRAIVEGWDLGGVRDGSESAPYIIKDYFIQNTTVENLMFVKNTDIWFEISNVVFDTEESIITTRAINLTNVNNAVIKNSEFRNMTTSGGTYLKTLHSSNILVYNNTFLPGSTNSVWFDHSENFSVWNNSMDSNQNSVVTTDSKMGSVYSNKINGSANSGINLVRGSEFHVYNNVVTNSGNGIRTAEISFGTIEGNTITNSTYDGISMNPGNNIVMRWNNLFDNTNHIQDDIGNVVEYNYYNTHTSNDNDGDGIYDDPFPLAGYFTEDDFPLVNPHNISAPTITTQLMDQSFDTHEDLIISWDAVFDNYNNSASFNILYRSNSDNWKMIQQGITDGQYTWEINDELNGQVSLKLEAVSFGRTNSTISPIFNIQAVNAPSKVEDLSGAMINETGVLSWTEPSSDGGLSIASYMIYRGPVPRFYDTVMQTTTKEFNDTTIDPLKTYYYKISAVNAAGFGPNSTSIIVNDTTPPNASIEDLDTNKQNFISGKRDVKIIAGDLNGISSVSVVLEGEILDYKAVLVEFRSSPYQFSFDTRSFPEGTYSLTVIVSDISENQAQQEYQITINQPAPTITASETTQSTMSWGMTSVLSAMLVLSLVTSRRYIFK